MTHAEHKEYIERKGVVEYTLVAERETMSLQGDWEPEQVREIIDRLNKGEVWAWAGVTVEARAGGLTGWAHLGGCSYRDEREFMESGYYVDLKRKAWEELRGKLAEAREAAEKLGGFE